MKLLQVAQRATDLDRAAEFYELLLGRSPSGRFDPPGLLFFDLDGVRLLLDRNAPAGLIYLAVDDLADLVGRLSAAGVEIVSPHHLIFSHTDGSLGEAGRDEWHAFVQDPEGNPVGLVEWR